MESFKKTPLEDKCKIVVRTLDIDCLSENYDRWKKLSSCEKLDILVEHIKLICADLSQIHPRSLWLIAAKEYVITEPNSRAVSAAVKEKFKRLMSDLAKTYSPNLLLIPGSLSTYKTVKSSPELFQQKYVYFEKIASQFRKVDLLSDGYLYNFYHKQQSEINNNISFIRNTAFVFFKKEIYTIDKKLPYHECIDNLLSGKLFFQFAKHASKTIGKKPNACPYLEITCPFSQKKFLVGVEICRDHKDLGVGHSVLGHYLKEQCEKPLFQILLSDSIRFDKSLTLGSYLLHVDGYLGNQLVELDDKWDEAFSVRFSDYNLLKKHFFETVIPFSSDDSEDSEEKQNQYCLLF